jgi:acetyltransferase-like isoleucine patch superfamily enzyme
MNKLYRFIKRFNKYIQKTIQRNNNNSFAHFGPRSSVSSKAMIIGRHGISIGDNCHILDHAIVQCGPHSFSELPASPNYPDRLVIGNNCSIQPYAFISTSGGYIEIGDNVCINPFCVLYGFGGLKIGRDVMIANSCVIVPQNHVVTPGNGSLLGTGSTGKGIIINDNVWLGSKVVVLDGVEIGKGSVIAAGAIVTKNIPAGVIAAGIPARIIRNR